MASKLLRAVVLGPPGSGKGTVCERIARSFGLQHLSSGQFLRESLGGGGEVGILAKQYLERGLLVPDHVITRVMMTELEKRREQHWLLDGFPRTLGQAKALDKICELDLVISLNIPFETLKDRLSARWVHPASGRVYNMDFNPPHVQGVDDLTGEPLVQREDDKPEAVAARLRKYKDAAKPVIELYNTRDGEALSCLRPCPAHAEPSLSEPRVCGDGDHRTIESLRLEKTSKIIESNRQPNTSSPLHHVPKHHTYTAFKYLQGW
ncbi:adenylate kinase 4, mitochondrial isoform X1 [Calonectris borealis]|uniref:adenylate kinase 4, mitochondrial isoform X1 n=1 Tax=Calonectris borealis TaxID=1323832 RepID=UPI003F4BF6DF